MYLFLKKIIRVEQWWSHILPPILLFYYIGLFSSTGNTKHVFANTLFLIFISIITAIIGYFINDLFDIKDDLKANKRNYVAQAPSWLRIIAIPIILLLVALLFYCFKDNISTFHFKCYFACIFINLVLFVIYSMPPVRFKKVVYISTIVDALYSGTFFYIIAYIIANNIFDDLLFLEKNKIIYLIIFCYGFIKGIRNHLSHLCEDKINDEQSGIDTLATRFGIQTIQTIANLIFSFEIIMLMIIQVYLVKLNIVSILFTLGFLFLWIKFMIKNKSAKQETLNDLHEVWLPVIILILLIITQHQFYFLAIIHFLFFPYHISKIYFTAKNGIFKLFHKEPISIKELLNGKQQ